MYESYYGITEPPFQLTPDPKFLYFSPGHQEAYAQLLLGIRMRRGFVLLTGEVGTGKTTLIRAIMRELDSNTQTAFIFHTLLSTKGLLQNICKEFHLKTEGFNSKTEYVMLLHDFLQELHDRGGTAVLIIDEAHNLKEDLLEEVRLLSNFETPDSKLLQICLVGQPELLVTLAKPQLRQLDQRISLRFHLDKLNLWETKAYIEHRLSVAGMQMIGDLFTTEAITAIHEISEGTPRKINILCENAMVMGYVKSADQIDRMIIEAVAHEDTYQEFENAVNASHAEYEQNNKGMKNMQPEQKETVRNFMKQLAIDEPLDEPLAEQSINGASDNGHQHSMLPTTDPAPVAEGEEAGGLSAARPEVPRHERIDLAWQPLDHPAGIAVKTPARRGAIEATRSTPETSAGPDGKPRAALSATDEIVHKLMKELRRNSNYLLFKKPQPSTMVALFMIGFFTYLIAILSAAFILVRLNVF